MLVAGLLVVAALVIMLGILSIFRVPAQLLPKIEKPVVTVVNAWPGASPKEIESELTVPVEEVLQGTPGMTEMFSWSMSNFGFMQLEFALETDMTRALIDIISRLNRLRPLPANAEKPQVSLGEWGDANDQLIEYFVQQLDGDKVRQQQDAEPARALEAGIDRCQQVTGDKQQRADRREADGDVDDRRPAGHRAADHRGR